MISSGGDVSTHCCDLPSSGHGLDFLIRLVAFRKDIK